MIYLIGQIIMALLVAVVLGAAIGWLIHRASHDRKINKLRQAYGKQKAQLSQARSDVAMLNDDFDELQQKSQQQILSLREENQQIPSLRSNLEKSQLLVRQMMQRHETAMRELGKERDSLLQRMSESDSGKAALQPAMRQSTTDIAPPAQAESSTDKLAQTSRNKSWLGDDKDRTADSAEMDSDAAPYDEVIEIADTLQRELKLELNADTSQEINLASTATKEEELQVEEARGAVPIQSQPRARQGEQESSKERGQVHQERMPERKGRMPEQQERMPERKEQTPEQQERMQEQNEQTPEQQVPMPETQRKPERPVKHSVTPLSDSISDSTSANESNLHFENSVQNASHATMAAPDILLDKTGSDTNASVEQGQLDGSQDNASLFYPVSQHDDLQQIFGIGPLTEKALNELGITSYSQLAQLNEHDIQKIADALDIGSARIERDNWVGNARRQLEEVLEQL